MLNLLKNKENNNIKEMEKLLDQIEQFILRDRNDIEITDKKIQIPSHLNNIYNKIKNIAHILQEKTKKDLGVNGKMLIVIEKMSDGDFSDTINISTDDPYLNYFAKSLNKTNKKLHSNFTNILYVLKEYERGFYINSINEKQFRNGEIKNLLKGINNLKNSITQMLKDSYSYGYQLQETASLLNQKLKDIISYSDKQSKTIDEIYFNIEELMKHAKATTNIIQNLQQSSIKMKNSANQGMNYANKTVNAMQEINNATSAIEEAIEVIDQIAFQTNILSLNAAVEAATAGEAGKGFAVVASEVRNLASRSADAAKSIKELVSQANKKANEGKKISDDMIQEYKILIENIGNSRNLINETTQSINHQLENIDNIENTLKHIKNVTDNYVKISHETNYISQDINEISQKLFEITEKTEFKGKDEIAKDSFEKSQQVEYV